MPRYPLGLLNTAAVLLLSALAIGCHVTTHATQTQAEGPLSNVSIARSTHDLEAVIDEPGPLEAVTVHSADWSVGRRGLINLHDPKAEAAGLNAEDEAIHIDFHVIKHPTRGTFLIDTGVERALRDDPQRSVVQGFLAYVMNLRSLRALVPLGDYLENERIHPAGVFLTHLHLDHITGMGDVPYDTPLFVGLHEVDTRAIANVAISSTVDRAMAGHAALTTIDFREDSDHLFEGVTDVFGDGSFWALLVPGHTPGSLAFVARTTKGPVLYVGDTCHTSWGWENDVEPGYFTADHEANKKSLAALRALVARHPRTIVRLGHEDLVAKGPTIATSLSADDRPKEATSSH